MSLSPHHATLQLRTTDIRREQDSDCPDTRPGSIRSQGKTRPDSLSSEPASSALRPSVHPPAADEFDGGWAKIASLERKGSYVVQRTRRLERTPSIPAVLVSRVRDRIQEKMLKTYKWQTLVASVQDQRQKAASEFLLQTRQTLQPRRSWQQDRSPSSVADDDDHKDPGPEAKTPASTRGAESQEEGASSSSSPAVGGIVCSREDFQAILLHHRKRAKDPPTITTTTPSSGNRLETDSSGGGERGGGTEEEEGGGVGVGGVAMLSRSLQSVSDLETGRESSTIHRRKASVRLTKDLICDVIVTTADVRDVAEEETQRRPEKDSCSHSEVNASTSSSSSSLAVPIDSESANGFDAEILGAAIQVHLNRSIRRKKRTESRGRRKSREEEQTGSGVIEKFKGQWSTDRGSSFKKEIGRSADRQSAGESTFLRMLCLFTRRRHSEMVS